MPRTADWYDVDLLTAPFVIEADMLGLLLPALVITRIVDGREGLRELSSRTVRVLAGVR